MALYKISGTVDLEPTDITEPPIEPPPEADPPVLSITANQLSLTEGNDGSISFLFTVARTGEDLSKESRAKWNLSSQTADGSDLSGDQPPMGGVVFAPDETTQTITVKIRGDTEVEPNELFIVTLSDPIDCTISGDSASATILNDDAKPLPPGPMTIALTPDGQAPVYLNLDDAVQSKDLITETVQQHDFRVPRHPSIPFFDVRYRPDFHGTRHELVAELVDREAPNPGLGPYHMALLIDGEIVLEGSTPNHWPGARWRIYTSPRPVVYSVQQLQEAGLISQYIGGANRNRPSTWKPYTPMGMAGVEPNQGITGERDDIGSEPAWNAADIRDGDSWEEVESNTEASATIPWFFRDANGQIFNIDNDPVQTKVVSLGASVPGKPIVSKAHFPSLAYYGYLRTRDPYWLEALQAQANYSLWVQQNIKGTGILWNSQVRGCAWTFRDLLNAAMATPESVEDGGSLLTKDYFMRKLVNNIAWLKSQTVDCVSAFADTFRFAFTPDYYTNVGMTAAGLSSWQNDMLVGEINRAAQMGVPGALEIADWLVGNMRARTEAGSGWNTTRPEFYYRTASDLQLKSSTPRNIIAETWAELEEVNLAIGVPHNISGAYVAYMVQAMRWASARGHTELDAMIANWDPQGNQAVKWRSFPPPANPPPMTWPEKDAAVGSLLIEVNADGVYVPPAAMLLTCRPSFKGKGSSHGQTISFAMPGGNAGITNHPGEVVEIRDTHSGSVLAFVADFRFVAFKSNMTWDIPAKAWVVA